jgi:hypothetical protein
MLAELARWLRCAGHDTALAAPREEDKAIIARCAAEERLLFTRDRDLARLAKREKAGVVLIQEEGPIDTLALMLAAEPGIDWTLAPFTRCMVDNSLLIEAGADDLMRIPQQSRELPGPFRTCPTCRRVYWPGSHFRRMRARLERWRSGVA